MKKAIGLGFWLPSGRANFVSSQNDEFIKRQLGPLTPGGFSLGHLSSVTFPERKEPEHECSVLHKVVEVLKKKNFRTAQLIPPEYLEQEFTYLDDPEGIVCEGEIKSSKNIPLLCKFLVEHNGFYLLWTEDSKALDDEKETLTRLQEFLMGLLLGEEEGCLLEPALADDVPLPDMKTNPGAHKLLYPYKVQVKDYNGLLPFFQLNMVMEGLDNYFFDPGVFFEKFYHIDTSKLRAFRATLQQKYGLQEFFGKLFTPLQFVIPDKPSPNPFNDLLDANNEIITKIFRQFLQATTRSIQEIKWNLERCRRHLLNDMISAAHRHSDLLQIQSSEEEEENSTPNSALLKGFIVFLEAKLPILLNVQRHMRSVLEEGRLLDAEEKFNKRHNSPKESVNSAKDRPESKTSTFRRAIEEARFTLSETIYSWNALIEGLADNIKSIDRAIEQGRMDRILHEQEQIRAEQEAIAENNRITERSGSSSSIGMDEETSAAGANLLTVIGISLAVVAILIDGNQGTDQHEMHEILKKIVGFLQEVSSYPFLQMTLIYLSLFAIISLVSFLIQLFIHRIIQVLKNIWRRYFGQEIVYFYELDARIEELFSKEKRRNLFNGILSDWGDLFYQQHKTSAFPAPPKFRFWDLRTWLLRFPEISKNYFSINTGHRLWQKWTNLILPNAIISLLYSYPFYGKSVFGQKEDKFILYNLRRRYFRTERIKDDEALHKIQFEAELILPWSKQRREFWPFRVLIVGLGIWMIFNWNDRPSEIERYHVLEMLAFIFGCFVMYIRWRHHRGRQMVPCYFTYEILFHKNPNVDNTFVLRELRFLAQGFQEQLSWEDSRQLKVCIIHSLIAAWMRDAQAKQFLDNLDREPVSSFLET